MEKVVLGYEVQKRTGGTVNPKWESMGRFACEHEAMRYASHARQLGHAPLRVARLVKPQAGNSQVVVEVND